MDIGAPELLLILGIAVLVLGVGRISRLGGELGTGLREFRRGLQGEPDPERKPVGANSTGEPEG